MFELFFCIAPMAGYSPGVKQRMSALLAVGSAVEVVRSRPPRTFLDYEECAEVLMSALAGAKGKAKGTPKRRRPKTSPIGSRYGYVLRWAARSILVSEIRAVGIPSLAWASDELPRAYSEAEQVRPDVSSVTHGDDSASHDLTRSRQITPAIAIVQ